MDTNRGGFLRNLNPWVFCALLFGGCASGHGEFEAPDSEHHTPAEPAEIAPQVQEVPAPAPVGPPRQLSAEEVIDLRMARTGSPE